MQMISIMHITRKRSRAWYSHSIISSNQSVHSSDVSTKAIHINIVAKQIENRFSSRKPLFINSFLVCLHGLVHSNSLWCRNSALLIDRFLICLLVLGATAHHVEKIQNSNLQFINFNKFFRLHIMTRMSNCQNK